MAPLLATNGSSSGTWIQWHIDRGNRGRRSCRRNIKKTRNTGLGKKLNKNNLKTTLWFFISFSFHNYFMLWFLLLITEIMNYLIYIYFTSIYLFIYYYYYYHHHLVWNHETMHRYTLIPNYTVSIANSEGNSKPYSKPMAENPSHLNSRSLLACHRHHWRWLSFISFSL